MPNFEEHGRDKLTAEVSASLDIDEEQYNLSKLRDIHVAQLRGDTLAYDEIPSTHRATKRVKVVLAPDLLGELPTSLENKSTD